MYRILQRQQQQQRWRLQRQTQLNRLNYRKVLKSDTKRLEKGGKNTSRRKKLQHTPQADRLAIPKWSLRERYHVNGIPLAHINFETIWLRCTRMECIYCMACNIPSVGNILQVLSGEYTLLKCHRLCIAIGFFFHIPIATVCRLNDMVDDGNIDWQYYYTIGIGSIEHTQAHIRHTNAHHTEKWFDAFKSIFAQNKQIIIENMRCIRIVHGIHTLLSCHLRPDEIVTSNKDQFEHKCSLRVSVQRVCVWVCVCISISFSQHIYNYYLIT